MADVWQEIESRRRFLWIGAAIAVAGAVGTAWWRYKGTLLPFAAFNLASIVLLLSALVRTRWYGYSAIVAFLLLGFWVKLVAFTVGVPLLEPTGDFRGSASEWDSALLTVTVGFVGLVLGRVLFAKASAVFDDDSAERAMLVAPSWFGQYRRMVWAATWIAVIAGAFLNFKFSFHQIGVNPKAVLPPGVNAAMSWWLTTAAAIWLAVLIEWERRCRGEAIGARTFVAPAGEAALNSVAMLSRGLFIMRMLPYFLVYGHRAHRISLRGLAALGVMSALGFVISLGGAFWLRLHLYPARAPAVQVEQSPGSEETSPGTVSGAGSQAPRGDIRRVTHELGRMILGRWIGLEGVLAVTSCDCRGLSLFREGLLEDPRVGTDGLYQRISGATYKQEEDFTFLTLPGVVAVLAYSSSRSVVFLGSFVVIILVLISEQTYRRLFRNEYLCAVVGVSCANVLVHMNFPYLTAVFFVELWGTLLLLWLMARMATNRPRLRPLEGNLSDVSRDGRATELASRRPGGMEC